MINRSDAGFLSLPTLVVIAVGMGSVCTPAAVKGQGSRGLRVGDTVRVWVTSMDVTGMRATVAPWRSTVGHFVRGMSPGDTLAVPFARLTRLDAYRGRSVGRGIGRGAAYGALVGTVVGGVIGEVVASRRSPGLPGVGMVTGSLVGLSVGGVVGGAIGGTVGSDRWERAHLRVPDGYPEFTDPGPRRSVLPIVAVAVAGLVISLSTR